MSWARAVATAALCAARVQADGTRLRITNGCSTAPLWIAHEASTGGGPDPQNVRIDPLQFHDFRTDDGLSATRYWPKMACDEWGHDCGLGGSGGPGQKCVGTGNYERCAPPIDTKFEASFGQTSAPCNPDSAQMEGCDYVDVSLVDGWTLPFRLELNGDCVGGGGATPSVIDCSGLSYDTCPEAEFISTLSTTVSLKAINQYTGVVSGCYSPCSKLIDAQWHNEMAWGRSAPGPNVAPYCCPTPPESPEACRAGPVRDTSYVETMHRLCPGVYGYAYDDAMGLLRCSSKSSYNLVFYCPAEMPKRPVYGGLSYPVILVAVVLLLMALALAGFLYLNRDLVLRNTSQAVAFLYRAQPVEQAWGLCGGPGEDSGHQRTPSSQHQRLDRFRRVEPNDPERAHTTPLRAVSTLLVEAALDLKDKEGQAKLPITSGSVTERPVLWIPTLDIESLEKEGNVAESYARLVWQPFQAPQIHTWAEWPYLPSVITGTTNWADEVKQGNSELTVSIYDFTEKQRKDAGSNSTEPVQQAWEFQDLVHRDITARKCPRSQTAPRNNAKSGQRGISPKAWA